MKKFILLFSFLISISTAYSQIVISEIMYNDPSSADSLEYIELTNTTSNAINLQGFSFTSGIKYTFPFVNIGPNGQVLVSKDSIAMQKYFGKLSRQWNAGEALNNSGETIKLVNGTGAVIDSVAYADSNGWPDEADGEGYSLVLCDLISDNNLASNWNISVNNTNAKINNTSLYGTPLSSGGCITQPTVRFSTNSVTVNESGSGAFVRIIKKGVGPGVQSATLNINLSKSTAQNGSDVSITVPVVLNFSSNKILDTQLVFIPVIDDSQIESDEDFVLDLSSSSLIVLPNAGTFTMVIKDDDTASEKKLILTGVFDAQANGLASAKGVEVFVADDIADLSIYGIGSANNGGGSNGVEFVFPQVSVSKGTYIHLAADSALFNQYFGFKADYITSAMNINGDDAIELFENGGVLDVFGDINLDGTGQPWEYLDGWAYRVNGTGPDGNKFEIGNWFFGGVGSLDGAPNNSGVANPFPINTYSLSPSTKTICKDDAATTEFETSVSISILTNDILPNGVKKITLSVPQHGDVLLNNNMVIYTPNDGYCGSDSFSYILEDNNSGKDTAEVNLSVKCALSYPKYTINTVTSVDALGVPDSIGVSCELKGIVYGNDFQGGTSIQFYVIDNTGGISVFSNDPFGYTVKEGDEVAIRGTIVQFSGLTQISPDTLWLISQNNPLKSPTVVTILSENTESEFVKINKVAFKDKSQWKTGMGTGFTVDLGDKDGNTIVMRVDNDIDLFNQPVPSYTWFNLTGIGSQFDNTSPFTSGYQILPRYASDLEGLVATFDKTLDSKIQLSPNPSSGDLLIQSDLDLDKMLIRNQFGAILKSYKKSDLSKILDISDLPSGMYFMTFKIADSELTKKLIKQ
jgi:hypothetical protein